MRNAVVILLVQTLTFVWIVSTRVIFVPNLFARFQDATSAKKVLALIAGVIGFFAGNATNTCVPNAKESIINPSRVNVRMINVLIIQS